MFRIIAPKRLREYAAQYPGAGPALRRWEMLVKDGPWKNPADLKATFGKTVDPARVASGKTVHIFDIHGGHHRLIAALHFDVRKAFILRIMPHAEYDLNRWKEEL